MHFVAMSITGNKGIQSIGHLMLML